jgi:hypothetical protein
MRVTYESTLDDRVRDSTRLLELTSSTWKYLRNRIILVIGVAVAALVLLPTDPAQGALSVLLVGAFYILCAVTLRIGRRAPRCRRHLILLYGNGAPVPAQAEMDETGITLIQGERRLVMEWPRVDRVADRHDAIELTSGLEAIVRIPNRVFESSDVREEWLSYMRSHCSPKAPQKQDDEVLP